MTKLAWKRAQRNRTNNLVWESRCGNYTVSESARYDDIEFESVYYKSWCNGSPVALHKRRSTHGHVSELTQYKFRTKAAAQAACQKHADTQRRKRRASKEK